MTELRRAVTPDQEFLAGVCERLDRQNELLGEIRDRLPAPSEGGRPDPGTAAGGEVVELTEPAAPASGAGGEPLTEPAAPARKPAARKPAVRKPRTAPKKGT